MRVMLVDDSSSSRMLLRAILEDAGFTVCEADSGQAALDRLEAERPDLITMDVHMPGMSGFTTTRRIMAQRPTPIVIVTGGGSLPAAQTAMQALEVGALQVLDKPAGPADPQFALHCEVLVAALRRLASTQVHQPDRTAADAAAPDAALAGWLRRPLRLLAVGASAGGPPAIKKLLEQIGPACPWPVLLVQHISPGFAQSYCEWLTAQTPLPVQLAGAGKVARPGHIYVAPDDLHLLVDGQLRMSLDPSDRQPHIRPSIDVLFDSMARALRGDAIAVLLSGMGRDGVEGLARLKALGALTLVQQPASAVVEGMPQAALERQAGCFVQTPRAIGETLNRLIALRQPAQ
ncbi:chemotaxis protein CheB [Chitinimonas koreensis]|uniref:chemotaxis protein CheB n=1 Tax=Chitinimonas koreensis TaxID=356302 RepID=UPI00048D51AF|nr:chemotaxis protein CheB [Chitinimonas koreensis]QNM97543.1 chemotaxis protein CheB [Chitinimonas koreensis]